MSGRQRPGAAGDATLEARAGANHKESKLQCLKSSFFSSGGRDDQMNEPFPGHSHLDGAILLILVSPAIPSFFPTSYPSRVPTKKSLGIMDTSNSDIGLAFCRTRLVFNKHYGRRSQVVSLISHDFQIRHLAQLMEKYFSHITRLEHTLSCELDDDKKKGTKTKLKDMRDDYGTGQRRL